MLAHTDPLRIGEGAESAFPKEVGENARIVSTPVFIGDTQIGSVTMGFSLEGIQEAIGAVQKETLYAGGLAAGVGSLFLFPLLFGLVFIRYGAHESKKIQATQKQELAKVSGEVQRKNRQIALLSSLHGMMQSESAPDRMVSRALHHVLDGLDLKVGWVLLSDKETGAIRAVAEKGLGDVFEELQEGVQNGKGEYYKEMLRAGEARFTAELPNTHPLFDATALKENGRGGLLEIPLKGREENIGVLGFLGASTSPLAPDEKKFLEDLGAQIGSLIENAVRFDRTRKKFSTLSSLHRANQSLLDASEYSQLLQAITKNMVELLSARRSALFLYDKRRNRITGVAGYGIWDVEVQQFQGEPSPAFLEVIEGKKPVQMISLNDEKRKDDPYMKRFELLSALAIPIALRTRTLGVIVVDDIWRERRFSEEEINLAVSFAKQAATSLKRVVNVLGDGKVPRPSKKDRQLVESA